MLMTRFFVTALFCAAASIAVSSAKFRVVREWNYVNFTWPSEEVYQDAVKEQRYILENNIVAGLKYFDGFYYLTLPRMKQGVPATLARIPAGHTNETAPLLSPFPSWELNNVGDCKALQNVQNVEIDPSKGQIWIIDGGRAETLTNSPVVKCMPKLLVYDIGKMENIVSYTFPEHVASFNGSFLYDIVLDNTDQGYAYITDNSGKDPGKIALRRAVGWVGCNHIGGQARKIMINFHTGIIVFSVKDHQAWKIRHSQSMRADPNAAHFRVNDVTISASLNIASIALGPRIQSANGRIVVNEDREVYYAPLSSLHLYSINSSVLRNGEFAAHDGEYQGTVKDYGMKNSQTVGMTMDNRGVLYYSLLSLNSIGRWDSNTPFQTGQRIIAKDERYLEWVNSLAFDESGNLTLLVNRLNRFIYGKLNISEPNFRLIASPIGGKSYLYDESYNYESAKATEAATSSTTMEQMVPAMKPGMDQDPYLAPQPAESPEPKAEPEPTTINSEAPPPSAAGSMSETTTKLPAASTASEQSAIAVLSLLTAVMLFVV